MVFKSQEQEIWESIINVENNMGFVHFVLTLFSMSILPSPTSMSTTTLTGCFWEKNKKKKKNKDKDKKKKTWDSSQIFQI